MVVIFIFMAMAMVEVVSRVVVVFDLETAYQRAVRWWGEEKASEGGVGGQDAQFQ